ncbi:hypothetical protein TSO221_01485 [Azospirillum sp. TSO22-1]|nr:hypothetical protein TSO221_01485 [Azospirillum sp. TSO22-1]
MRLDRGALEDRIIKAIEQADWDWSVHDPGYVDSEVDNIGRVIDWRLNIERQAIHSAPFGVPAPRFDSPEEASAELSKALDGFFARAEVWRGERFDAEGEGAEIPPAPLLAVKATTGTGKTRGMVKRLLDSPFKSVLYVAPTHGVLEEIKQALEAERTRRLKVNPMSEAVAWEFAHVYGRLHRDNRTNAPTMCQRAEVAAEIQKVGGNVGKVLCGTAGAPLCPHYLDCPFIDQQSRLRSMEGEEKTRIVYLIATDTLPHRLPGGVRKPDLIVIDEAFWGSLISTAYAAPRDVLALDLMRGQRWTCLKAVKDDNDNVAHQVPDNDASAELAKLWQRLMKALEAACGDLDDGGWFPVGTFSIAETELAKLKTLLGKCRRDVDLLLNGTLGDAAIKKQLGNITELHDRIRIYRALCDVLIIEKAKSSERRSGAVAIVNGSVTFRRSLEPSALGNEKTRLRTPTVFLDADLDPEIVRRWWPMLTDDEVVDITCRWSEHATVFQVADRSFSKDWALSNYEGKSKKTAAHQRDLDRFIRHTMRLHGVSPDETMVISYKDLIEALNEGAEDGLYRVPDDPEVWRSVGWFNALAGIDRWKGVKLAFVIGRPQATPRDYSDLARAIWMAEDREWTDVKPDSAGRLKPPSERRQLHTKSGDPEAVWVSTHPDPRTNRILQAVTWGQVMQADGRIRPVYRGADRPVTLYVLGNIPRGIHLDEVFRWGDVLPTDFDEAVMRGIEAGGVIPTSDTALARFCPDLWPDKKAVERERRNQEDGEDELIPLAAVIDDTIERLKRRCKHPLHGIGISYSTKGVLMAESGEARLAKQAGSPFKWVRLPSGAKTRLSEALINIFGNALEKVKLDGGVWLTLDELRTLEAKAEAKAQRIDAAWIRRGVVPIELFEEPIPPSQSPRAKFRREVAARWQERWRQRKDDVKTIQATGMAILWEMGAFKGA